MSYATQGNSGKKKNPGAQLPKELVDKGKDIQGSLTKF